MKKRVLLIDESLTVQKVVALTLDRNRYSVSYAKSRAEAAKWISENPPELILVSDQVADITVSAFPKEVESWVGRDRRLPPLILITGQDLKEVRNYQGVLRKPFSPQALQSIVVEHAQEVAPPPKSAPPAASPQSGAPEEMDDHRLQKIFNETFNDEANLVRETFESEIESEERTLVTIPAPPRNAATKASVEEIWNGGQGQKSQRPSAPPPPAETAADLWGVPAKGGASRAAATSHGELDESDEPDEIHELDEMDEMDERDDVETYKPAPRTAQSQVHAAARAAASPVSAVLSTEDSVAYKAELENQVEAQLSRHNLEEIVDRILDRMVPPIVEKLVEARLEQLLKEQEEFIELKP